MRIEEEEYLSPWSANQCITYYLYDQNLIRCYCNSVKRSHYFSIVHDSSRIEVDPEIKEEEEPIDLTYARDEKIYLIILTFFVLMVPSICCCGCLDNVDYNHIQDECDPEETAYLESLAKIR